MMKKITRITLMTSMVAIIYTLPVFAASGDINFEKQHNSMLKQEILAGDKHNNKDMSVKDFLVEYNQSH